MLRDPRRAADPNAPLLRGLSVCGLLLFGLVVAGVRPDPAAAQTALLRGAPGGGAQLAGEAPAADPAPAAGTVSPVVYMPPTVRIAMIANPKAVLEDPAVVPFVGEMEKNLAESKDPVMTTLREAGVQPRQIESLAVGLTERTDGRGPEPGAFAIRLMKPVDRSALEKSPTSTIVGGVAYRLADDAFVTVPDERTLLFAKNELTLSAMLLSGQVNRDASPWARIAEKLGSPTAAVMIDASFLAAEAQKEMGRGGPTTMMFAPVMPLLTDTTYAGIGLNLAKEAGIRGYAECKDESAAKRVAETMRALVTLGQNTLRQVKSRPAGGGQEQEVVQMFLPLAEQLLTSAAIETEGNGVTLSTKANGGTAAALGFIMPAVAKAREAARRTQSQNNLKQIALAFHMYHDAHGHFPPAVIEENGVARSWRVEILPFIEQNGLYQQYRKDQPWDSPDNKRILEQMPAVFRDPADTSAPNSASYFALTGAVPIPVSARSEPVTGLTAEQGAGSTLFSDKPVAPGKGPGLMSILDGTSNTILVVESSRDVPWTKPEDIAFDPAKADELLKSLGGNHPGGFNVASADGAVRFLDNAMDAAVFKNLVTPAGGEVIGEIDPAQLRLGPAPALP